jgi:hypothetical protein
MKTQHGRDLTGAEMAQTLDEFVNAFSREKEMDDFVKQLTTRTHRTLQQLCMTLFVKCIEAWAEDKGGHDARNEATVKLAKKIVEATGDKYDRFLPHI